MRIFSSLLGTHTERHEVLPSAIIKSMRIKAHCGNIRVTTHDAEVGANIDLSANERATPSQLDRVIVAYDEATQQLTIDTTVLRRLLTTIDVDIVVNIPAHASLDVTSASAECDIEGTYTSIQIRTTNGDIDVAGQTDTLDIHTASGDVDVSDCTQRTLHIVTASGDIEAGATSHTVQLTTASGDIEAHAATQTTISSASGDIELTIQQPCQATINSASGDIDVRIQPGFLADVDAKTLSGHIHTNLDFNTSGTSDTPADIRLHVQSLSGDISVTK
jgi:DUF4097 and DUF4098 domain-containing protein YvlB